jgi:alpha-beta hydrolase superfamily lysophospholipase
MTSPDPLDVVGGAGGLAAEYADLSRGAAALQAAALELLATADGGRRALTDADLVASAALDPVGFARVEAAVLAAVAGPHGLAVVAGRLEQHGLALRAAVVRYATADRLTGDVREVRHWAEGAAAAMLLPLVALAAVSPVGMAAGAFALHDGGAHRLGELLAEHPGLTEEVAGAAPTFVGAATSLALGPLWLPADGVFSATTGSSLAPQSLEEAARLLALLYPRTDPAVFSRGTDPAPAARAVPHGVGDLVEALLHRDALARGDAQGEIDVRRVSWDGHTSWVVDLPGTKDWQLDPRSRPHLNDLATNLTTMAGDPSPRVAGLTRALELAGVAAGEPVVLVGHSQGGLVAVRAAEDYAASGRFTVTHVVTAGSPVARMAVPPGVQLLSLENRADLVPRLDGQPAPDQPNRTTVLFDAQTGAVGTNHALATAYLPAAQEVDVTTQASLDAWRRSMAGVLPPSGVRAHVTASVYDIRSGG